MSLTDEEFKLLFEHLPRFKRAFMSQPGQPGDPDKPINLTHVHAIMFLDFQGDHMLSSIARFLHLEKGSFTPVANRLIEWGYVEKIKLEQDKRKTVLHLTEEGRKLAETLKAEHRQHIVHQIDRLPVVRRRQFFSQLRQMQDLLDIIIQVSQKSTSQEDHRSC